MDYRQLICAADKSFGPYGNGQGTDIPYPTDLALTGINPSTYIESLNSFTEEMHNINASHRNTFADFLTVSNSADGLFDKLPYSEWTIAKVALSAISPEWLLQEGRTIDEVIKHAGCIVSSRTVAKVFQDLSAWDDALDID